MIRHCATRSTWSFHEKSWIGTYNHPMMDWPLSSSGTGSLCVKEVGCEEHPRWSSRVVNPTCNERLCCSAREWEQRGQVKTWDDCLESLVDRQWYALNGETRVSTISEKQTVDSCMIMVWLLFALVSATVGWCNFRLAT